MNSIFTKAKMFFISFMNHVTVTLKTPFIDFSFAPCKKMF